MFDDVEFYLEDLKSKFNKIDKKKYYLSYSGGKDSHFLYWFIKEYLHDTDIEIVACNTYMEHQEIRERMYKYADKVLLPKMKPMEIKEKYGIPCFSKIQDEYIRRYQNGSKAKSTLDFINGDNNSTMFKLNKSAKNYVLSGDAHKISPKCCDILKKQPMKEYQKESGKKIILGVRGNEGVNRKSKYKSCFTKEMNFTPIWDLSDKCLDDIIKRYNIEVPKVYDYIERTGCMGCPYGSYRHRTEKELQLITPQQKKFVCEYFKESYDILGIKGDE